MTLTNKSAVEHFKNNPFLDGAGFYAVVDGQFGSTGKGLLAAVLAESHPDFDGIVTSNAGPNSGHTSYYGDEKIVLRQLPTFAVTQARMGNYLATYMNAGAIIDKEYLLKETKLAGLEGRVFVHPQAAVTTPTDVAEEKAMVDRIGSTGKGTGAAMASKVMRDPSAVAASHPDFARDDGDVYAYKLDLNQLILNEKAVFAEVSQGFSLSLNAGGFYPHCTSRDCTVGQAMSDAGVHPHFLVNTAMVVRTFPIRVAGNSGGCYDDQYEMTWEEVGQQPELTTVTQKQRRIFSWSKWQFKEALSHNRPQVVLVNFMNYLKDDQDPEEWLEHNVLRPAYEELGYYPTILLGWGPENKDVEFYR